MENTPPPRRDLATRQTLIMALRERHDDLAWEEFVRAYRPYLYNVARATGSDHHQAEELAQQVLVKVWGKLAGFVSNGRPGAFRAWLNTILRHTRTDLWRRSKRYAPEEAASQLQGSEDPELDAIAEREWRTHLVALAIERARGHFNDKTVECFIRFARGETPATIAADLGIVPNSVYVNKLRVQDFIRASLRSLEQELG